MNLNRWDDFILRERLIIEAALRIYLGEIAGNCANAAIAESLQAELEALKPQRPHA
jgi:hypothetical protein